MLQDFEDKIKNDASTNAREWFGKATMSSEVIDALWSPMLKYPKDQSTGEPDKSRSPTLKVKLPVWENEFKFELFDVEHNTLIPNEDKNGPDVFIQKGSNVACILQCGGIWFANGKFGVTWKLYQGVVKQVETLSKGQCHISDDVLKCESSETSSPKPLTTYDSDGEEETQEETQEEPQEETQEEPQEEPQEKPQEEEQEEEPKEEEKQEEEPQTEKIPLHKMKELLYELLDEEKCKANNTKQLKKNTIDAYFTALKEIYHHFKILDMNELLETKEQDIINYIEETYKEKQTIKVKLCSIYKGYNILRIESLYLKNKIDEYRTKTTIETDKSKKQIKKMKAKEKK
jgi:hypothetical protein